MTAQKAPPKKPSHWLRNVSIGVVVVMVVLAAVGSWENRQPGETAPLESSAGPGSTGPASTGVAFPDESPSPPPSGSALLAIKGTGPVTSDNFQASGDSVDVEYNYTCGANDSFTASFFGAGPSPVLPDILVSSDTGDSDSSITTEDLNGNTGPFHIEIDSTCTWSVTVIGEP